MPSQNADGRRFGRPPQRIRAAGRVLVVPFVIVVFAMNVAGGPSHGSITRPPASDAEITAFIADQVRDTGIPGASLAIVRDGQVSTTAAFGTADSTGRPMTADTPFVIGSVSKPITATAVLQLVDAGKIELDAPVQRYLPDFALATPSAAAAITVRQLLDQTSGLPPAAGDAAAHGPRHRSRVTGPRAWRRRTGSRARRRLRLLERQLPDPRAPRGARLGATVRQVR